MPNLSRFQAVERHRHQVTPEGGPMDSPTHEIAVPWWAAVLVALGSGAAALVTAAAAGGKKLVETFFRHWSDRLTRKRYAHGLREVVQMSLALDQLEKVPAVDRVLWFIGRNGGGLPRPGGKYTVRAEHGWAAGVPDVSLWYDFNLTVDAEYTRLLAEMVEKGRVTVTADKVPDGTILKTYYRDEGVVQAVKYFLAVRDNELHYLSVASYKGEFTADQLIRVEMVVQRLRALMDA